MALTPIRWLVAAGVGCALAIGLTMRIEPARPYTRSALSEAQWRASQARSRATRTADRVRMVHMRDSVRRVLGAGPEEGSRIAIGSGFSSELRRALDSLAARVAVTLPGAPAVPVDVAFVLDTVTSVRGVRRLGRRVLPDLAYVLPRPDSSGRCLVLARIRAANFPASVWAVAEAAALTDQATVSRVMGPCAFYAWFGMPGTHVETWLRARGWAFAETGSWVQVPQIPRTTDDHPRYSPFAFWHGQEMARRGALAEQAVRCSAGDTASCRSGFLEGARDDSRFQFSRSRRLVRWGEEMVSRTESRAGLGGREQRLLADMVLALGPERFRGFWQSPLPVEDAFRAAAGEDVGAWTRSWAQRTYGKQSRGPGVSRSGGVSAAAMLLVAVVVTVRSARRRQVS